MDENFNTLLEEVKGRLKSLGYELKSEDDFSLNFVYKLIEEEIKNKTNLDAVPEGLHFVFVDMICGRFLYEKRKLGNLSENELEAIVVKSISEGDTSVTYDENTSPQALFEALVSKLMNPSETYFIKYREMVW